jgi:phospholipid N-methyltransferase
MHFWAECGTFFREFRQHSRDIGSLLPSSRYLARALVSGLPRLHSPFRILEVGPGTGAVTSQIVKRLGPEDLLDAVEVNERFVALLRQRFEQEPALRRHRDRVKVIHGSLDDIPGQGTYDLIVSGLPLNGFPAARVREIFQVFQRLLRPGGTLTYFEYVLIRQLQFPFVSRRERLRLYRVGQVVKEYIHSYQVRRQPILMNVPPAIVRHLRLQAPSSDVCSND